MKIIDCEQGSPEWHAARCGKVTASRIADIMRRTKTGVSASRATYAGELVAERLSGQVAPSFKSGPMEWGLETEGKARDIYGFMHDVEPVRVGLIIHPTIDMSAASPDSLVGDDGLLEIKCPNTATHIRTLLGDDIEPDYIKQMQWQMACSGRSWCDFVSYDPRMPEDMALHVRRVPRDSAMIIDMTASVVSFLKEIDATVAGLIARFRREAAA